MKRATKGFIITQIHTFSFNPRPREEGDFPATAACLYAWPFNPRPREEGDGFGDVSGNRQRPFNPRPREEGDARRGLTDAEICLSIHALVKRATSEYRELQALSELSIHALVKRATIETIGQLAELYLSIHALVKRATTYKHFTAPFKVAFNPRPREEGDTFNALTV